MVIDFYEGGSGYHIELYQHPNGDLHYKYAALSSARLLDIQYEYFPVLIRHLLNQGHHYGWRCLS